MARRPIAAPARYPAVPAAAVVAGDRIVDLTARLGKDGELNWDMPAGKWTILRIGYTPTGMLNHPSPKAGEGLECDKLSKEAVDAHFAGLMAKLVADVGPAAGKTLVSTHIDSWEVGFQNWTPKMRRRVSQSPRLRPAPSTCRCSRAGWSIRSKSRNGSSGTCGGRSPT